MPITRNRGGEKVSPCAVWLRAPHVGWGTGLQPPEQPGLGVVPVADRGRPGDAEGRGGLVEREAAEEPELDQAAFALVELRQLLERGVHFDGIGVGGTRSDQAGVERDL